MTRVGEFRDFAVGQRVRLSGVGRVVFPQLPEFGTVVALDAPLIRVAVDAPHLMPLTNPEGRKAYDYHPIYWVPE